MEWKPIEATFRRTGRILHLHFPNGELIRTTPEHPFWVDGKGWTPAGALKEGDRIATLVGDSVPVSEVFDTEQWEPVYNIRVADFHTYFVGEEEWGWAAWAHNSCYEDWVKGSGFDSWYNNPDVKNALDDATARRYDNANHDKARAMFKALHDDYDFQDKTKNFPKDFREQWLALTRNATTFGNANALAAFKATVPQANRARATAPLSSTDVAREKMVAALEAICRYNTDRSDPNRQSGDPRQFEFDLKSITITGKPQRPNATTAVGIASTIEHQRKVAVEAAHLLIDGNTKSLYLDWDLNNVLKKAGLTVTTPMSGQGKEPDIVRVRTDGTIDIIEIQSESQTQSYMRQTCDAINLYMNTYFPGKLNAPADWLERTCLESAMLGVLLPAERNP